MKAMILERPGTTLVLKDVPKPQFSENEVLLDVEACAVCRTDLHIVDGELNEPKLPLILGHQIIGRVVETGSAVKMYQKGDRLGVPWLSGTCQHCEYCASERENLCDMAIFTGYKVNGGFAEQCVADPRYCFTIDSTLNAAHTAPLLCGGLIGYRAYKRIQDSKRIGFYGFGSAAHMMTQVARFQEKEVYAFTQPGDQEKQKFALSRGAVWAGDSDTFPPVELDGAVIFAPVGALLPQALRSVKKGGHVVCAGIHMSDIPSFPYSIL